MDEDEWEPLPFQKLGILLTEEECHSFQWGRYTKRYAFSSEGVMLRDRKGNPYLVLTDSAARYYDKQESPGSISLLLALPPFASND